MPPSTSSTCDERDGRVEAAQLDDAGQQADAAQRVELDDREMETLWRRVAGMRRVYAECDRPRTSREHPRQPLARVPGGADLGAWECDFENDMLVLDSRTADLIACTPQQLHDRPGIWETRLHPDDRHRTVSALAAHLRGQTPIYEAEYRVWTDSGTWRWILDRGQVVERDANGLPLRMAGFHCGIAAREDDRRSGPQHLKSLTAMAGGVAHTFNNLLMSVQMNTELARWHLPTCSPLNHYLEEIGTAVRRAAALSTQMLTFTGKGTFLAEPIDLSTLVREQLQLLDASVADYVGFRLDLAPGLPPVRGDAAQIRQLVTNLLVNAIEALGHEVGSIVVRTAVVECDRTLLAKMHSAFALREGPHVCLEVADTGCGMDCETQARMFDPFFTTKFIGRGLGLAVVLGVVRGHNGAIGVSSRQGLGTTITVLFSE